MSDSAIIASFYNYRVVTLMNPYVDKTETSEKSFAVNGSVFSREPVKTIRLFLNGEPAKELLVETKNGEISAEIPLFAGLNRLSAVAYDENGFSSNLKYMDVVCTNADAPKPDIYVLTVGISRYPKLCTQWQLSYAHTDAENLADAFKAQEGKVFGTVHIKTLANENATKASITQELSTLQKVKRMIQ